MSAVFKLLSEVRGGPATLIEADKGLRAAMMASKAARKKATLIIMIEIEPDLTDEHVCTFSTGADTKLPKKPRVKGAMYVSATGDASPEDPRQHELELERQEKLRDQGVTALAAVGRG